MAISVALKRGQSMRSFIIGTAVVCLTGCATEQLNTGLQKVIGQPVDVLVADWGYPSAQRQIMGHGGGVFTSRLNCTVQVAVNAQNIITSYQWNGNNGGCAPLARRIPH